MAVTPATKERSNVPAIFGGDLPDAERDAYEEGLDADEVPGQATQKQHVPAETSAEGVTSKEAELEKQDSPSSSASLSEGKGIEDGDHRTADLEKGTPETTAVETEKDPNIVDWDGPDDPENPMNWTARKKWANIAILSLLTFLTPLASSMFAPGVPEVLDNFHTTNENLATFVVSVYILGFAFGPLVIAPASELYGRVIVYHICNVGFILWTVACALATDMNMLIGFRFMAGAWGIAPVSNGGKGPSYQCSNDLSCTDCRQVVQSRTSCGPNNEEAPWRSGPWDLSSAPSSALWQAASSLKLKAGDGSSG